MKAILSIGYRDYLFPTIDDATKVMKLMSEATPVNERIYNKEIKILKEELVLELKTVPAGINYVDEHDEPYEVKSSTPKAKKRLGGGAQPSLLRLTRGRGNS